MLKVAESQGRSAEWLAERVGLAATTLRRWHREREDGRREPDLRGRRPFGMTRRLLRALFELVEELLQAGVRAIHRACPEIPRAWLEWAAVRVRWRREQRRWRAKLTWTRSGAVWAMDHTQLDSPIDGEFKYLFVVRDLASGRSLSALPTRSTDAEPVAAELARLFEAHGAPLALKSDNGSGLVGGPIPELLRRWGVTPLRSPPRTPQFNGAIEAGMGSLSSAIAELAARHGRPAAWTRDDVHGAIQLLRQCGAPRRANASPEDAWHARVPIGADERESFLAALEQERVALLRDSVPSPIIEGHAVRNVLTEQQYLVISRL